MFKCSNVSRFCKYSILAEWGMWPFACKYSFWMFAKLVYLRLNYPAYILSQVLGYFRHEKTPWKPGYKICFVKRVTILQEINLVWFLQSNCVNGFNWAMNASHYFDFLRSAKLYCWSFRLNALLGSLRTRHSLYQNTLNNQAHPSNGSSPSLAVSSHSRIMCPGRSGSLSVIWRTSGFRMRKWAISLIVFARNTGSF